MDWVVPRLTENDHEWLRENQPGLAYFPRPDYHLIEGRLQVRGSHAGVPIEDEYQIRLEIDKNTGYPTIRETGGRLEAVYKARGKPQVDLHIYDNGTLCLAARQELRLVYLPNASIRRLFDDYIAPFFYSQSYYERRDDWPWPHLPHGVDGVIEWFTENSTALGAARETASALAWIARDFNNPQAAAMLAVAQRGHAISPRAKCLCGSGQRYNQCHNALWRVSYAIRHPDSGFV